MALEEFKHFFQEATDTKSIDVSLLSSPTTINLFKKYRRYELPFFYYNADTRREFGEIPSNILDSYFALCKKLTQKEDISFDEYSKYLNLFYTVTDIPKDSTIKEVSSICENIGPDKKRDSLVKFGVGTKKPYNKSVRLFHTSDNPNIKNLKPFFRSQSPRDRHVEALFPRPRVYFGYNVPVTRLGGSLDRQTEEQKKKFFDEKVVYEYVGPSEYITAVYTDPELSGGVAVYVETTRELPVKRITYDEYVNGIKDKNIQESYGPEEDHTTGTSEFDEPRNDDPDDCYCEHSIFDDEDTDTEYDWLAPKLDNEIVFWLGKCYNLWTSVPDVVYSSARFGVDIIDYLPDDWELAVTTPDIWKDLIDQTIRCSNAILYTIDEFDKLDPEQKMKHEGVKFDHDELIENINQIIQLANNVKSSSIFNILDSQHVMSAEEKAQVNDVYELGHLFKAIAKDWVSKYKPNRLRYFQEAYDVITGKEIPIDYAYTMDEMKERTFSFKDLFSKEKRAKRYIEKRITKLLPLFMTDINKLLSAHNNENLDRSLIMDMYYPRTVIVTHHDPATGMTYTTTEQHPTDEMVRLSFVISFFRKIIKKQHMMDMLDNPDVVYGLREELDAMLNCIHDIFKIKSTKEDLEKLFGVITSISNDINSFIDSFESNNEVSTMFDSIDYFSDVDVEPITIQEAKLPSKKRKKLPDSDFALVYTDGNGKKIRKYPIHDEAHCRAAAHMFPRGVPLKYKATVARKILRRAHKFGIDTSGWKNLNNFTKRSDK